MRNFLLLTAITIILLSGCTEKNYRFQKNSLMPLTDNGKLLTAHTWKEASVVVHKFIGDDTIAYDITKQFAAVDQDDYTLFYRDGTFLFEEGKSRYSSGSAQQYRTGTWRLQEEESVLSLTFNQATDRYTILSLNPFKMVLSLAVQKENVNYKYIITYTPEIENSPHVSKSKDKIYTEVEIPPYYPGGVQAFNRMLQRTQKYPAEARKKGIEGKVLVAFVIDENGKPGNFEVVQALGYGCDEAAVQTLKTMPLWKPGQQNGEPVHVKLTLPIVFKLN